MIWPPFFPALLCPASSRRGRRREDYVGMRVWGRCRRKKVHKGKCLHGLDIDSHSLEKERSGHLPITMLALWYLMEVVQYCPIKN